MNTEIEMVTEEMAIEQVSLARAAAAGHGGLRQACGAGFLLDLGKNRKLVERAMIAPVGSGLRGLYEKKFPLYRRLFKMIDDGRITI